MQFSHDDPASTVPLGTLGIGQVCKHENGTYLLVSGIADPSGQVPCVNLANGSAITGQTAGQAVWPMGDSFKRDLS